MMWLTTRRPLRGRRQPKGRTMPSERAARGGGGGAMSVVLPIVLIVSLFFLWGMANNLNDVLIAQFRKAFALSDLQSGLVQSAFYMGYFLLALPASLFMQ